MYNNLSLEYANAYVEVLEVLNNMSEEDYNKIPKNIIKVFETNKNENHIFKYDFDKDFNEQGLSKQAKLILANLFRDYWATETEKKEIIAKQNYARQKVEEEKRKKYDPDVFKNKRKIIATEEIKKVSEEVNIIEIEQEESILQKIINKIKSIFTWKKTY